MRENQNKYDLILCADTLCYFGALEDVFSAAFLSLRGSGWLVFTVEALTKPGVDETYRLNQHGRYCHAQLYVQQCLQAAGFSLHSESVEILRKESGQPVDGLVIVAAKGQRQANRTWLQRLLGNAAENS